MKTRTVGVLALIAFMALGACESETTVQDRQFIRHLKESLRNVGDRASVATIHPGEWTEVCINPIGTNSNIEVELVEGVGLRPNGVDVVNGANTYADDNVWGIYFRYPGNKVEYFRIPWQEMKGGIQGPELMCAPKERATLEIIGNSDNRTLLPAQTEVAKDYIEFRITTDGEY